MVEAKITLTQPQGTTRQFVVSNNRGHHFLIDDPTGASGPKPTELIAAGLGGCTAFDVITILRKKRQQVTGYQVEVIGDQAQGTPAVFTGFTVKHIITGVDIDPKAVEEAIRLSEEKYCSVGLTLAKAVPIKAVYEIIPADVPEPATV